MNLVVVCGALLIVASHLVHVVALSLLLGVD